MNEARAPRSPGNDLCRSLTLASARLRKLRRERYLIEQAIDALAEISRVRQSRDRRGSRN